MAISLLMWSIGAEPVSAQTPASAMPAGEVAASPQLEHADIANVVVLLVPQVTADLENAHADLAFTFLQMPLNYFGLRLVEHAITAGEPADLDPSRVRAVGTWLGSDDVLPEWVWPWLQRQPPALRTLHFGSLKPLAQGDDGKRLRAHLHRFGLGYDTRLVTDPGRIRVSYPERDLYPFESKPVYERAHLGPWNLSEDNTVWVATRDSRDPRRRRAPVVTGDWGGIGLHPWFVRLGGADRDRRWYADPFAFCRRALALEGVPAPDPSVLTGRRMFVLHVDGDGFESVSTAATDQNCGEVFRDRIVDGWPIPMTISYVVASLTDHMQPAEPTERMRVAREIAERPWVELASHTVLHPLNWRRRLHARALPRSVVWYPTLEGFEHSMVDEVRGSIAFIDQWLAPAGKRCRVMLWSGAANPSAAAIQAATDAGCVNLNGGLFRCDALHDSIGFVSPWGRQIGEQWQVFAGAPNENEYPGFFTTMPSAFAHVSATIERTGGERILKPANVYCHFYSAEHPTRLAALEGLLQRWVRTEQTVPVFASTYARAVHDAQFTCAITRTERGYRFRGFEHCRTIRLEGPTLAVDWSRCRAVIGAHRRGDRLFVHLADDEGEIAFAKGGLSWLHVEQADCRLSDVSIGSQQLELHAHGFGSRLVVVAGAPAGSELRVRIDGREQTLTCDARGRCEIRMPDGGSSEVHAWLR